MTPPANPLTEFREIYLGANDDRLRLAAIQRLGADLSRATARPDRAALAPVLDGLLHYARCDSLEGRLAAARLLRDLWCGLPRATIEPLFQGFTLRLLDSLPALQPDERRVVWDAVCGGFDAAGPRTSSELCRKLTEREASRLRSAAPGDVWSGLKPLSTPNLDVVRLVVRCAPAEAWPALVRDLWLLYNWELQPAGTPAPGPPAAGLGLGPTASGLALQAPAAATPGFSRAVVRRSSDGEREYLVSCWPEIVPRMLRRTLEEAQPGDLGDTAATFFDWLGELAHAGLPEPALEPLLHPMAVWPAPQMVPVLERWSEAPYNRDFRRRALIGADQVRAALGITAPDDALVELHETYARARDDARRLAAIRRYRARRPEPPPNPDPSLLRPLLEALLDHSQRDSPDARFAAARLLRDLWLGLQPAAMDAVFPDLMPRLLEGGLANDPDVRVILRAALEGSSAIASPPLVEQFCREVTTREAARCLDPWAQRRTRFGATLPPAPNFHALRFVVKYAPPTAWPRLARDLWRLYNLDLPLAEMLARGANLSLSRASSRAEVRRTFDGRRERVELCWDLARRMVPRTLEEAHPDDLGDEAAAFFTWLEGLAGIPEPELAPLLAPAASWPVLPMIRVLDRWSHAPYSDAFRHHAAAAAATLRATLGLSPEIVPAPPPYGDGKEPAPSVE